MEREQEVKFHDNRPMAVKRLESIEGNLKRDEELSKKFCLRTKAYSSRGICLDPETVVSAAPYSP